ncbi:MAG TPA: hypothetical protein VJ844_09435, partial [Mucilaginibacter sp.]|nr:hypothetical protein [Mucilaginibacter sp.]
AIYKDTMFVTTFQSFYIVHQWKKELIFDKTFWYGLYANSIAVLDKKHIYVGMHGGYAEIDLEKRSFAFYKHKEK